MGIALILTLGTRDIQINKSILESREDLSIVESLYRKTRDGSFSFLARQGCAFLLKNFEKYKNDISYPIVKPVIQYVLDIHKDKIDYLFLVTTDQAEDVGDFRNGDTIESARLLEQKIIPTFYKLKVGKIEIKACICKENVAHLDSMFAHWDAQLNKKVFDSLRGASKIYLANKGGIDAINTALLLNSLNKFGDKLIVLDVNERISLCTKLQFPEQYIDKSEIRKAEDLVKTYQYPSIKNLRINQQAKIIAEYAEQRLNFNFKKCAQIINELSYKEMRFKEQELVNLQAFKDGVNLLKELYVNAKIKYHQEAYMDFLLRFFRIVEEVSKNEATKHLGFAFNKSTWQNDILNFINLPSNNDLKTFLDSYRTIDGTPLNYKLGNIVVFISIVHFYDRTLADTLEKIRTLAQMRNNGIGAHGFEPVAKDLIDDELAKNGLTLQEVFDFFDEYLDIRSNPFDNINHKIVSLL